MGGWMGGWMGEWVDGWIDGWVGGWVLGRWMKEKSLIGTFKQLLKLSVLSV
jgi:hypothetical protein